MLKIRVLDTTTGTTIKEFLIEESEAAHVFAAQMEEIGIPVEIDIPSTVESLAVALGVEDDKLHEIEADLDHEMSEHEESCCFEKPDKLH